MVLFGVGVSTPRFIDMDINNHSTITKLSK